MKNKGKVSAEEMIQQLGEMVPAMQIVAEGMGISTAELGVQMKKGLLDVDKTIALLIEGFNKRFGGMMEQQSKTLTGVLSNIGDTVNITLGAVVLPVFERIRDALLAFQPVLDNVRVWFENLSKETQTNILIIAGLLGASGPIAVAVAGLIFVIGTIGAPLLAAIAGVAALATAYATNFGGIRDSVNAVLKDLVGFYSDHKTELDTLATGVGAALSVAAKLWAEHAVAVLDSLRVITLGMRVAAGDWGAAWTQFNEMAKKEQEKSNKQASEWMTRLRDHLRDQWVNILVTAVETWTKIRETAVHMWQAIADAVWGPIKRVYDKLKDLDWGTIFKYMTEAAKQGLQVHSPPIIAVWLAQIGEAATTAADNIRGASVNMRAAFADLFDHALIVARQLTAALHDQAQAFRAVGNAAEKSAAVVAAAIEANKRGVEATGEAASKAATKIDEVTARANVSAQSILSTLSRVLPQGAQKWVDFAGVVIGVLQDLGVKLPQILGDIFGRAGSSAGGAASQAGSQLGVKLLEGLSLALEGAKGIMAASGAPNRVSGAISGGISGVISGAMIGSMIAPGIGTAIGAIVGGIAGIIGGAYRSPLQMAQEAAALQQAKDAIRVSQETVLQLIEKTKQSWIETLDKGRALLESIAFYSKVPRLAISSCYPPPQ